MLLVRRVDSINAAASHRHFSSKTMKCQARSRIRDSKNLAGRNRNQFANSGL